MKIFSRFAWLVTCLGLLLAPAAWAVNMQLGQMLPYLDCKGPYRSLAASSLAAVGLAVLAAVTSWRSAGRAGRLDHSSTRAFIGRVSAAAAVLFGFALALQAVSSLVLSGCER
ncbi:MAG: hypothetical protein JWQ17_2330 [Tardiphaga sp.]|nr:hypothetical protein [Tardiphaga sp.]